jgi:hypothetical protein
VVEEADEGGDGEADVDEEEEVIDFVAEPGGGEEEDK